MKRNTLLFLAPLALGLLLTAGCAQYAAHQTEQNEAQKIGAEMQRSGSMPQQDYVKVRELQHQVAASHAISETDLNWTLAFLQRANDGIARARALTVISEVNPLSDTQRAKISPVVTPYLSSPDELTRQYAQRVQRHSSLL